MILLCILLDPRYFALISNLLHALSPSVFLAVFPASLWAVLRLDAPALSGDSCGRSANSRCSMEHSNTNGYSAYVHNALTSLSFSCFSCS